MHTQPLGLPTNIYDIIRHFPGELPPHARHCVSEVLQRCEERDQAINQKLKVSLNRSRAPSAQQAFLELEPIMDDNDRQLSMCRGLLSAFRRFPQELLLEIFKHYLAPSHEAKLELDGPLEVEAWKLAPHPGTLRSVCRSWNSVVVHAPHLWSHLTLYAQLQNEGEAPLVKPRHARIISDWMNRAGNIPRSLHVNTLGISVRLKSESGPAPTPGVDNFDLGDVLKRPSLQRIERLKITGDAMALGMGRVTFPDVKSVVVRAECPWDLPDRMRGWTNSGVPFLPSVTQAVFESAFPPRFPSWVASSHSFPWRDLTRLYVGNISRTQCRQVLKCCTSLVTGCFKPFAESSSTYPDPHPGPFNLPHLQELAFIGLSPFDRALAQVSAPAFTKLRLFAPQQRALAIKDPASLFSNLTHLTLVSTEGLDAAFLIPIIRTTTRLEELFCRLSDGFEQFFEFLTFRPSHEGKIGAYNLPMLRALGLYMILGPYVDVGGGFDALEFPNQALHDLLASRTKALEFGEYNTNRTLARLRQLVMHGTDLDRDHEMLSKLNGIASPFADYGLNVVSFGVWDCRSRSRPVWGEAPRPMFRHWDEGFMDFMDETQEYSLYPQITQC